MLFTVKMEIKSLSNDVISKIRSFSCINSITQCVTELVLNSLDAKSSAIAIRINPNYFRIQVVDNGIGISQENMENIARKYFTSKCFSLEDLDHKAKVHGYRGESLWGMSNVSKTVSITSKYARCDNTFSKDILNGKHAKVILARKRQSNGTTVTILGLFKNLPVRQKIIKKEFEMEEIVGIIRSLAIINPQVSFSIRDDSNGKLLLKYPKYKNVIQSFIGVYPNIKEDDLIVIKMRKEKFKIESLLSKEIICKQVIQHMYVNKRPVFCPILRKFLNHKLKNGTKKGIFAKGDSDPLFIINIKCPVSCYDLIYNGSDPVVQIGNFDLIQRCMEKMISCFLGKPLKTNDKVRKTENECKSVCGVSDLAGAVKGCGFKNWLRNDEDLYKNNQNDISLFVDDKSKENILVQPENDKKNTETIGKTLKFVKPKPLPIQILELKNQGIDLPNNQLVRKNFSPSNENGVVTAQNPFDFREKTLEKSVDADIISETIIDGFDNKKIIENYQNLENKFEKFVLKKGLNETLFSNFTNNEDKGKDVIMYMFLKSAELFGNNTNNEHCEESFDRPLDSVYNDSRETVIESKIFYKNIMKTKTHQMNKTISVSVKVKRKRNKSPEEKITISSDNSFVSRQFKRKKVKHVNEINFLNIKRKDQATSPYFKRQSGNNYSRANTVKRNVDKIIQTTLSEVKENVRESSIISNLPRKTYESFKAYGVNSHNYRFTVERNGKQKFIMDKHDADFDDNNFHNIISACFKPPKLYNEFNYHASPLGKETLQNPASASFIFNDIAGIGKKSGRFSNWNDSRLFHFKRNDIVNDIRKMKLYNTSNFSIACTQHNLPDIFQEVEKPIRLYGGDEYFQSPVRKRKIPSGKRFAFENLSVSPITKTHPTPNQFEISNKIQFIDNFFPEAQIPEDVLPFKKFATEGDIPYFYDKAYWNKKTYQNEVDMKIKKKGKYANLNQFRKFPTESFNNSKRVNKQRVKQNIDNLFVRPISKSVRTDQRNESKYQVGCLMFTKDSLENATNGFCEEGVLWKKFIEKKRNQERVKNKQPKTKIFSSFTNQNKLSLDKGTTKFLKHTNFLSRCGGHQFEMPISPDLFSDSRRRDQVGTYKNYPQDDLTFLPNSQPSFGGEMNSSLLDVDVASENISIAKKESHLPTLTAIGNDNSNFVGNLNGDVAQDFTEPAVRIDEFNPIEIDPLSRYGVNGEWAQKVDNQGNRFYFNTRTGMTNFVCPQQDECFNFTMRPEFMPKGFSPVLMHDGKVDRNISPNSRLKLHDEILKYYESELDVVKWENYLKEKDPRKFFDELYKDKINHYENKVLDTYESHLSRFMATINCECKFSKTLFDDLQIVGQVDKKFIASIHNRTNLILFDQHAVHERVRLENLVREYEGAHIRCENITLFMIQNDIKLLKDHEKYLNSIGIYFRIFKNGLTIYKVPSCLYNKAGKEPTESTWNLPKLVEVLVQEMLNRIKVTRGVLTGSPETIHQVISLEACRGAIKFGDVLSRDEMKGHIKNLSKCLLPFQCAHGRPTLVPVLNLTRIIEVQLTKPQLDRLKKI